MYDSDNERTETMDLETQLEVIFTQIQQLRWTSLSGDRPPVLHVPADAFEPWDVNFDQQLHFGCTFPCVQLYRSLMVYFLVLQLPSPRILSLLFLQFIAGASFMSLMVSLF
ncbi:hypothetical protein K440DRAFT_424402 [Wilcoxina mikolae CBS 423.85]|nr:hypothetical protein K440DRAFT_424402 [Wilcoxina mikolae CBS 423.85]